MDRFGDDLPHGAIRRIGSPRFRHPGVPYSHALLALSSDGTRLASIGTGVLAVWDAERGHPLWAA